MQVLTNVFDLWVFTRGKDGPRYLLLRTSQEKGDRFFGGGRFWQIPGELLEDDENVVAGITRLLDEMGLWAQSVWAVEHVYPIYNRRRQGLELIPRGGPACPHLGALRVRLVHRRGVLRATHLPRAPRGPRLDQALHQRAGVTPRPNSSCCDRRHREPGHPLPSFAHFGISASNSA